MSQDIFTIDADALGHGVNSQGLLGGLAKTFQEKFPLAMDDYVNLAKDGKLSGGTLHAFLLPDGKWIYSLVSQVLPGPNAQMNLIIISMKKMFEHAIENNVRVINIPKIGAGIGGLNWDELFVEIKYFEKLPLDLELNICSL